MSLLTWDRENVLDPLREFERLQNEINQLFDYQPRQRGLFDRALTPPLDLIETADSVEILCDMPGVAKDKLELSVSGNVLTLKGEKLSEEPKDESKKYRQETLSGSFQRTISVPETADPNKIDAELRDGVLRISIAKREEVKPRQIEVKVK
ncbi:MAG TPA: Hsp20/alpha crystallin family protein [Sediminispirochaeta sp.]|nr:Hsp20/alpha crystallin family protein [Sediminispirochaeta sp.]